MFTELQHSIEEFAIIIKQGHKVPVGALAHLRGVKTVHRKYDFEDDPLGTVRSRTTRTKVIFEPSARLKEALE